eukprot:1718695-Amphidinium_carterae.2
MERGYIAWRLFEDHTWKSVDVLTFHKAGPLSIMQMDPTGDPKHRCGMVLHESLGMFYIANAFSGNIQVWGIAAESDDPARAARLFVDAFGIGPRMTGA